ncbi:uncharacterized protein BO97DRAFT_434384 [Aspergillus homomorphus CBS 101889]|uniref:SET domain-containing protein n=1 Tax=Aspergillus homomorphus (strain CBS 101889) TaxID=1450537 RepID=A0A395HX81_ASPHC|nr:hypothetical protein BO97DRAFT_434384 [Aspergillus homomorphus CBS 101889]RAL12407.1 hypothetical protein BO97DRAFT_434384 [Aspergillus homomorphus CBS 101889]
MLMALSHLSLFTFDSLPPTLVSITTFIEVNYWQETEVFTRGYLRPGTTIIVVEPFINGMWNGTIGLRVDHPSDLRILPDHDILVPMPWRQQVSSPEMGAMHWETKGNDAINEGDYRCAIDWSPTADEAVTIKLNRALASLRFHQFDSALRDLEITTPKTKPSEKALLRKAQALYHLDRFQESCGVHKVLRKEYPENTTAQREFARAIARLEEQRKGIFPVKKMQLEATKRRTPILDHATYIGSVSVRSTRYAGQGLFTTQAVKAGDLLLCEKAFAYAHLNVEDYTKSIVCRIDPVRERFSAGSVVELLRLMTQKLYKNPSHMPFVTKLYHGEHESDSDVREVDHLPVIDTLRQVQLSTWGSEAFKGQPEQEDSSVGVWPWASRISHSCYNNAETSFIGDMLIVRAAQDLPPGTEITSLYRPRYREGDCPSAVALNLRNWDFDYTRNICQDHEETTAKALATGRAMDCITRAYRRPAAEVPRIGLARGYPLLAIFWASLNNPLKAIEFASKAFESLGYVIEGINSPYSSEGSVPCWMTLAHSYRKVAPGLAPQAEEYAKTTYGIVVGEDETFAETFGWPAKLPDGLLSTAR